jgi:hypothetical protein
MVDEKEVNKSFLKAITETFKAYNENGARSNKKLIPIHKWFAKHLEDNNKWLELIKLSKASI